MKAVSIITNLMIPCSWSLFLREAAKEGRTTNEGKFFCSFPFTVVKTLMKDNSQGYSYRESSEKVSKEFIMP